MKRHILKDRPQRTIQMIDYAIFLAQNVNNLATRRAAAQ